MSEQDQKRTVPAGYVRCPACGTERYASSHGACVTCALRWKNGLGVGAGPGNMNLRNWFAGQALVGTLARHDPSWDPFEDLQTVRTTAEECFLLADAMMSARLKGKPD